MEDGPSTSYHAGMMQQSGSRLNTDQLPTITTQAELAPSTDSSSSRRSSDPLSSEPSTPTHPPTFRNMHHFQVRHYCFHYGVVLQKSALIDITFNPLPHLLLPSVGFQRIEQPRHCLSEYMPASFLP